MAEDSLRKEWEVFGFERLIKREPGDKLLNQRETFS